MKKLILFACAMLLLVLGSCTSTDSAAFWDGFNEGFNSTYNP
jgi:outer membrane lipoprotein-sorting protein